MYVNVSLIVLVLFVVVQSEWISSDGKINTNFLDTSLSIAKDDGEKPLLLSMPPIQHEDKDETICKTKRCDMSSQRNRSMKKNFARTRSQKNVNVAVARDNHDTHNLAIDREDMHEARSDKSEDEPREMSKILMRVFKDDVNGKDMTMNLRSGDNVKKCNTGQCVCYCKDENRFAASSKRSSMLGSSRKGRPERINYRMPEREDKRLNILQLRPSRLQHESLYQPRIPNSIDPFPIRSYQERLIDVPAILIPYRIISNLPSYVTGKIANVGIPRSSESRPDSLVGSNVNPEYRPFIHENSNPKPSATEESVKAERLDTSTVSSDIDATTVTETINVLEDDSTEIIGKTQEPSKSTTEINYADELIGAKTESNFYPNYSTDVTEKSNVGLSDGRKLQESEDPAGTTEADEENDPANATPTLTDYVGTSGTPSVIYSPMTYDDKLISMEECMRLFGRDVCVLRATSSANRTRENDLSRYTIAVPEYVIQTSNAKRGMAANYVDNEHSAFLSTSEKSNADLNENPESIDTESNIVGEISQPAQTYEPRVDSDEDELSSIASKDMLVPRKQLRTQTTDKTTGNNVWLGKSQKAKSSSSRKETKNPVSNEGLPHSANSRKHYDEKTSNLEGNQQDWATSAGTWKNIAQEATTIATTIAGSKHDFKNGNTNYSKESVANPERETSQGGSTEESAIVKHDPVNGYNFETASFVRPGSNSDSGEEDPRSTTIHDHEKSNKPSNKDDNLGTIADSPARRLPFYDNTLLLNSIRKVINDFTLDTRVGRRKDVDRDVVQLRGSSLSPEILDIPHLKNILSIPRIENMIVDRVKNVLSDITGIPRGDFANDRSHGVIRNTLQSMLGALGDFPRKLPPMTVEERQFKNGQWTTDLVTLAPLVGDQLSETNSEKLRERIRELLSSSAIMSQINRYIVRNIIVQSVKDGLINDEGNEEMDDSMIYNVLNDVLQTAKTTERANASENSDNVVGNNENTQATSTAGRYEMKKNVDGQTMSDKRRLGTERETGKSNDNGMQITTTRRAEVLDNDAVVISESTNLLGPYDKDKDTHIETGMPNEAIDVTREDTMDQKNEGNVEPLKPTMICQSATLQNDPETWRASAEPNLRDELKSSENNKSMLSEAATISSIIDLHGKSRGTEPSHADPLTIIPNYRLADEITTSTVDLTQETSTDYTGASDIATISPDRTKNVGGMEYSLIEKSASPDNPISAASAKHENPASEIVTAASNPTDEIDPEIILTRLEYNLPPVKYYSPETLKRAESRVANKNEIATFANFIGREISPDRVGVSDNVIGHNITAANNEMKNKMEDTPNDEMSTMSIGNLISSETNTPIYGNLESHPMDNGPLKLRRNLTTDNDVVKIHEVTTEVQRSYARTTYFQRKSTDDDRRIGSFSSEATDASNGNSMNDERSDNNYDLTDINNINRIAAERSEAIVSSSKPSLGVHSSRLSPSSITAVDDISELEDSQLYYISDGVKLPLEIVKLKDGSYALSLSKSICEIILRKRCSCCVPLQGRIVRSSSRKHRQRSAIADEKDYWPINDRSPVAINSMMTENVWKTLKRDEPEERIDEHVHWKRNLNKDLTSSMSVLNFARKYNLLLDFDENDVLPDGTESQRRNVKVHQSKGSSPSKSGIRNNMREMAYAEMAEDNYSDVDEEMIKYEKGTDNSVLRNVDTFNKKEKREHKVSELIDDERDFSRIGSFKGNNARPYRYEQNGSFVNRGTKVIKSMLYWIKSLFEER